MKVPIGVAECPQCGVTLEVVELDGFSYTDEPTVECPECKRFFWRNYASEKAEDYWIEAAVSRIG